MRSTALDQPPRIGISRCLLGESVRYDGGHKRDPFLTDLLGPFVEWVPVCPEVEAGLSTPREAMQLVGSTDSPRLITIKTGVDHTPRLTDFSATKLTELAGMNLAGYIFKKDSPSCGTQRVRVYNDHGIPARNGVGLFAQTFMTSFPLIPIEEEGRLADPLLRENFVTRLYCYQRWQHITDRSVTRARIMEFHARHKYLLLSHSREHYQRLGRLVAESKRHTPSDLATHYGHLFMEALKVKATVRKHVNVLQHLMGHFKNMLSGIEKEELLGVIHGYHQGLVPLIVPLTLIKHYIHIHHVPYVQDQVYVNPHPKELLLRNRL